ncbi:Hypothetical predicted protein [Mytilus galloprovincialis]|uniref:Uncharacterized protein n=1 Tax=Mytilus galloprovincialis TaxID=29158 RepID=A0A8B6GRA7_MYTGA|nr:Hypothetical predicted protein [Mytilus galloprovincialis]
MNKRPRNIAKCIGLLAHVFVETIMCTTMKRTDPNVCHRIVKYPVNHTQWQWQLITECCLDFVNKNGNCQDLCTIYTERITCRGADVSSRVNSSRLNDRCVSNFPDLDANKQGRENILAFKDYIVPALKKFCLEDFDNKFANISTAATFVRKDIFASNSEFKGTFPNGCQEASVPQSLLSLTRKRDLVDTFFQLGMSVSYDRKLEISTSMANDSCRRFVKENIVWPTNLLQNVFTSSAVNNIDHNPRSISSKESFLGTGISLFQHISDDVQGVVQTFD